MSTSEAGSARPRPFDHEPTRLLESERLPNPNPNQFEAHWREAMDNTQGTSRARRWSFRSGRRAAFVAAAALFVTPVQQVVAQGADSASATVLEEVVVTGSRIRRDPLSEPTAIMQLTSDDIDNSGLTNLGDALQRLPIMGSAPNSQNNVPGNSGFPQDGAGIGAGGVQLSLRNIGSKRTLVLVDGRRWIAGASASGVPSTVDLNTIPDNLIQRVEILQDGASAIYGSDAIGGVVNIITQRDFEGFKFDAQVGEFLDEEDGESSEVSALWGGGNDRTHVMLSASWKEEKGIETADRSISAFPNPGAQSCDVPGSRCSSFTPQARLILGPNFDFADITLNDGAINDGTTLAQFNPANPASGDFHAFTAADRFNFNGPGFNFLRTPNERVNLYGSVVHQLTPAVDLVVKGSYTNRSSATQGAPEPLCLGSGCGNPINDNFFISAQNPFNPFGVDLSVANGNMEFFGRRPLESGARLFFQEVDTYFFSASLEGQFALSDRNFYWDVTGSYGENRGSQEKFNSHNAAKLQVAMGDPAVCAGTPNCVPFNFFGGQGPDGTGSITQEMLDFVTFTQRDFSDQELINFAGNLAGDLIDLPAGTVGFAVGFEYRDQEGSFRPDPIAERAETAGIPSGATAGQFDVTEFYGELKVPLLSSGERYWELNLASRYSDYSTSGSEVTYKASTLFRPIDQVSLRGSISTGFRAPGIGELFGGAAREDFTFTDPCSDVLALDTRESPQSQAIIDNCAALGVPTDFAQRNTQLSARSAGNEDLDAETSDSFSFGIVWQSEFNSDWISAVTASVDYWDIEIDDAVQGLFPGDVIAACVDTLDPFFCDRAPRADSGVIEVVDNQLQNIGGIETSGVDFMAAVALAEQRWGAVTASLNATLLDEYVEFTENPDGSIVSNDLTGTHTNETFQRAFPDLRITADLDWMYKQWSGGLTFRWTDELDVPADDDSLDSVLFTDLRLSYRPTLLEEAMQVSLGFNNVFDEDPPASRGIGLSNVLHDLPGRVGYLRFSYEL